MIHLDSFISCGLLICEINKFFIQAVMSPPFTNMLFKREFGNRSLETGDRGPGKRVAG